MQSLPAFLIHLPENHGAQMTHNIKKNDSNKRLKPFETKVVRRTLNEGSAQAVLQKNQWQTTYPYLNHVLSGHITLSAHIQNASFHLYQYNKKDTKGLSSLPLATPQLFTFPQSLRSKSTKFNDSRMMLRKGVKPKDDRKTHNSSASKVPLP